MEAEALRPTIRSSLHMRLSKGNDSLNFSMRGSVAPVKRPPHSFFCSVPVALSSTACAVACIAITAIRPSERAVLYVSLWC